MPAVTAITNLIIALAYEPTPQPFLVTLIYKIIGYGIVIGFVLYMLEAFYRILTGFKHDDDEKD